MKHWKCDDTIVIKITDWKWFKQTFYKIEFTKLTSCKIVGSEIVGDDIEKGVFLIVLFDILYRVIQNKKRRNVYQNFDRNDIFMNNW